MEILIQAAQLLFSLSILVTLHEFGHFIPARLFKIKVEKFYLFFDWKFSLVKKQIGDTEWGIGWIPLGGYVKIAGMIDESMDTEQLAKDPEPWEFRSKPAWQRLIVMCGGVFVNLILGIFIYIILFFSYGEDRLAPKDVTSGFAVHPMIQKYGGQVGDIVLEADGKVLLNGSDVNKEIMLRGAKNLKVQHANGKIETIVLPEDYEYELFKNGVMQPFDYQVRSNSVDSILAKSQVSNILKKGDFLVAINDRKIEFFHDTQYELFENRGKKVNITFTRGNDTLTKKAIVSPDGTLGFAREKGEILQDTSKFKHFDFSVEKSISLGSAYGIQTLKDYASQLKYIFTEKGATSVGGFISIGKLFTPEWDWRNFWEKTALISIILAFMNVLPIPALDGGHIVFLLYEMATGKEAPQKVLEYAQYVGFFLLIGLLLYANGADIIRALAGG